jgi:hypothetical protein
VKPYDKTWKTEMMRHTKSDIIDILGARLKGMGDEMKFPNEIWIYDYEGQRWQQKEDASQQRYIHESRVPISCGGTMEENDANDLARAYAAEELNSSNWKEIQQLRKKVADYAIELEHAKKRIADLANVVVQAIKWGESEIHNEYDGTSSLMARLEELDFMRLALYTKAPLTSGSAEEKEIIGLGPNLAKLKGITSGRCSKHGTFAGDNCQECYKEICLTSGSAEIQCPIKDLGDVT